jgi:hypothetical protein
MQPGWSPLCVNKRGTANGHAAAQHSRQERTVQHALMGRSGLLLCICASLVLRFAQVRATSTEFRVGIVLPLSGQDAPQAQDVARGTHTLTDPWQHLAFPVPPLRILAFMILRRSCSGDTAGVSQAPNIWRASHV